MSRDPSDRQRGQAPSRSDAVERLYVYWIFTSLLLVLAFVVLTMYLDARLDAHAAQLSGLRQQLAGLEAVPDTVTSPVPPPATRANSPAADEVKHARRRRPAQEDAAAPVVSRPVAPVVDSRAGKARGAGEPRAVPPSTTEPRTVAETPDRSVEKLIDQSLRSGDVLPWRIADAAAADEALRRATQRKSDAGWDAATWSRLALVALLRDRAELAEQLAREAFRAGSDLTDYAETAARLLLAGSWPEEALVHAEHFAQQTGSGEAQALLASVLLQLGSPQAAEETLREIETIEALAPADQLAVARVWMQLHRWDELAAALNVVQDVPPRLTGEAEFLRAVALLQHGEQPESALRRLSELQAGSADATAEALAGDPRLRFGPRDDELQVWRGVALFRAGQSEAARNVLESAIANHPATPAAYYWLGTVALGSEDYSLAARYLGEAVERAPRHAPAWEALAVVALNTGDVPAALSAAEQALAANDQRAAGHFLMALAHARSGRADPTAAALHRAFALDPSLLAEARRTELFTRLFSPDELVRLARPAGDAEPATRAATQP